MACVWEEDEVEDEVDASMCCPRLWANTLMTRDKHNGGLSAQQAYDQVVCSLYLINVDEHIIDQLLTIMYNN
jgi:hypothetical protein